MKQTKDQLSTWLTEEFMCSRCDETVKHENDLCPSCRSDEEEAAKDRRFDEAVALGYGV